MVNRMNLKKGDLVWLPADITLLDSATKPSSHLRLSEPTTGIIVESNLNNENIYNKIHVKGSDWIVRTIDTLEVMSRA